MNNNKINILELSYTELQDSIVNFGLQKFAAKQIFKWLHEKIARRFDEFSNISKKNQDILEQNFYIPFLEIKNLQLSKSDGTQKFLFQLEDKSSIETVLIKHNNRYTLCVSSQVGCALKCGFCATGNQGFSRNLYSHEIMNQYYTIQRRLLKEGTKIDNIVFMGMGEPLLNFDNVWKSIEFLTHKEGQNLSHRKITISTSGVVPGIEKLIEKNTQVYLSISLHSANNDTRSEIMPINKKYDLHSLHDILIYYQDIIGRRISFEYILLDGINMSVKDAESLVDFVSAFHCMVNLIPYNPVEGFEYKEAKEKTISKFIGILRSNNINVTLRKSKGKDIDAACGQLRAKKEEI